MGSPYGPVNNHAMCPPGYRVTAYWWASHRGLPADLGYLQELGLRAARAASWLGIAPVRVPEGPYWCHTWEPWLWDTAAAGLVIPCPPAPPPPVPPLYRHSGDPAWESADGDPEGYGDPGYREAGDYG